MADMYSSIRDLFVDGWSQPARFCDCWGGPDLELLGFFFAELPTGLIFWICGAACFSPVVLAVGLFFYVGR
jgi:hypothetical protein